MNSLTPGFLERLSLSAQHARTIQMIGQHKGREELYARRVPQVLKNLRMSALIESAESSNRIEHIILSRDKIQDIVYSKKEPENRNEQEYAGYRDALNLIHDNAAEMPFSANIIKQLHATICRYLPETGGEWKNSNNDIVEKDEEGNITRIRFETVPAYLTDEAMQKLVAQYNAAQEHYDPLILIPLAVLDYLCVHPFRDGNGRTARLLSLMLLYKAGYNVGRYISLERVIEESKDSYYETLELCSQGWHEGAHNPVPWMTYFWGVLLKAYKEYEDKVGAITERKGSKAQLVKQAVSRRMGAFKLSDIETECPDISREHIRKVLKTLRDQGVIRLDGFGPAARYYKVG